MKRSRPGRPSRPASDKTREAGRRCYWKKRELRLAYSRSPENRARLREAYKQKRIAAGKSYEPMLPQGQRYPRWGKLLLAAKYRAQERGLEFNLTKNWAISEYTGHCAITGIPFLVGREGAKGPHGLSATIDRIDSSRGYIVGNCRFILFAVNSFKGMLTDREMVEIAQAIVRSLGRLLEIEVSVDGMANSDLTAASRETAQALLNRKRVAT